MSSDAFCSMAGSVCSPLLISVSLVSLIFSCLLLAILSRCHFRHCLVTLLIIACLVEILRTFSAVLYYSLSLLQSRSIALLQAVLFWIGNAATGLSSWIPALLLLFSVGSSRCGSSWSPLWAQLAVFFVCVALGGLYVTEVFLPISPTKPTNGTDVELGKIVADVSLARLAPCVLVMSVGLWLAACALRRETEQNIELATREETDPGERGGREWSDVARELSSASGVLSTLMVLVELPTAVISLLARLGSDIWPGLDIMVFLSFCRGGVTLFVCLALVRRLRETARRDLCCCVPDPGYSNVVTLPLDEEFNE